MIDSAIPDYTATGPPPYDSVSTDYDSDTNLDFQRALLLTQMAQIFDNLLGKADIAEQIMAQICQLFRATAAFVLESDVAQKSVSLLASQGLNATALALPLEPGQVVRNQVLEEGQLIFYSNSEEIAGLEAVQEWPQNRATRFIAVPIIWQGTRRGVLGVYPGSGWGRNGQLSNRETELVHSAATITGQVLFNARLIRESETARNDFTDMLVYGLKGPMASIMGALDLLYDAQGPDGITAQLLTIARRNGARMLTMIETLLDLNKLERGELQLALERTRLHQLIEIAGQALEDQFRSKNLEWRTHKPATELVLEVDISRMLKVLYHLLENALNFTEVGTIETWMELRTNEAGQKEVLVAVSDTGSGISPEKLDDLFNRFSHARQYRQLDLASGGGLGLNYAQLVIKAHGGDIWVESPGRLNAGTSFYFTLPYQEKPSLENE